MISMFKQGKSELALVLAVVAILMLLFVPIPGSFLDLLLLTNFSLGLVILLLTFYTDKPLSFSTFPSLILIATLFRLGLNVSSTRLILNDAEAGQVIGAIGSYVVGGNYVIGLVVFLILIVVQYVVVTSGAQRVAEVAARFTLDSMPGKQMSIDADLNMGIIDEVEAKQRRLAIEKEANFYGAMDGSTKFVKGDAIAGIIIILINIVGGLSIGVAQHGMEWSEALHTFTLLTVGDGIVTQIPSLIVATATGIIITRAASDSQLGKELAKQITSHPKILLIIALTLTLVLFMPGLPAWPLILLAVVFGTIAYFAHAKQDDSTLTNADNNSNSGMEDEQFSANDDDLYDLTKVEVLELRIGADISDFLEDEGKTLTDRLQNYRKQFALEYGLVLPTEKIIHDNSIDTKGYILSIHGAQVAKGEIFAKHYLAIDPTGKKNELKGINTKEPTYGLPALWIDSELSTAARSSGYTVVDPETTLLTHLTETLKKFSPEILTRAETEKLLSKVAEAQPGLLDELIPSILSYSEVQKVLQQLLQEKVAIRNLPLILEELVDAAKVNKNIAYLAEKVRTKLRNQICQALVDQEGSLNILTFEPRFEQRLVAGVVNDENNTSLSLDGELTEILLKSLSQHVELMMGKRLKPILLCTPILRRQLFLFCERALPQLHILSLNEIPTTVNVKAFAMISESTNNSAA
ncbi:flagellar biosynthesis protein FlhA [Flocculibacter collagenilyticus]|uniref:flagellar biosynthesis protein FlhA n=1 Tax=Flocculibacter collagenilyticus TaxID=2744479 RepID=UPI0018F4298B|nr:flagellar biosynthesis protein FlhA [Flocculibacter collagenilyticus]